MSDHDIASAQRIPLVSNVNSKDDQNEGKYSEGATSMARVERIPGPLEEGDVTWTTIENVLAAIGMGPKQIGIVVISSMAYAYFAIHTMLPSLSTISLWKHWPELEDRPVLFNSVFATGAFIRFFAAIAITPLQDRFGRLPLLVLPLIVSTLFSMLGAFAPNFPLYVACRGATVMASSVLPAVSCVYGVELLPCRYRAIVSMVAQAAGSLSLVWCSGMNVVMRNSNVIPLNQQWRWAGWVYPAPFIGILLCCAFCYYETPRFLLSVRRDRKKMWETFRKLTSGGIDRLRKALPDLPENLEDEVLFLNIDDHHEDDDIHGNSFTAQVAQVGSDLRIILLTPSYRVITAALGVAWAAQAFAHYGMNSYCNVFYARLGLDGDLLTMWTYLAELPAQFVVYHLMNAKWSGRIGAMKITALVAGIISIILGFSIKLSLNNNLLLSIVAVSANVLGSPAWGPLYSYSAEVYPTMIRGTAMGLFSAINASTTIVTTYVGSVSLNESRIWILPIIWGIVRLFFFLSTFFLKVEVNNQLLRDHRKPDENFFHNVPANATD